MARIDTRGSTRDDMGGGARDPACKKRRVSYSGTSGGGVGGDDSRREATPKRAWTVAEATLLAQSCRRSACLWTSSPLGPAASTTAPLWRSGPWLEADDASVESALLAAPALHRVAGVYKWIKAKRSATGNACYLPTRRGEAGMYSRLYKIQHEQHHFQMEVDHLRLLAFCPDMLGEQTAKWFGEVSWGHRLLRPRRPTWGPRDEVGRMGRGAHVPRSSR